MKKQLCKSQFLKQQKINALVDCRTMNCVIVKDYFD